MTGVSPLLTACGLARLRVGVTLGCLLLLGCGEVSIHDGDFLCGTMPPYCPSQQSCGGDGYCHSGAVDPAPPSPIVPTGTYALLVSGTEGHYLRTDLDHGTTVQVGWDHVGNYEQWVLVQAAPHTVALRCKQSGLYVTADASAPRAPLTSDAASIGGAQQFQLFARSDGTTGIFSVAAGQYVATDPTVNGDAFADREGPAASQGFTLMAPPWP
jgi:hypothetical protein